MAHSEMIVLSEEVQDAISSGTGIVALESSVIAQGLPRPLNLDAARETEAAVRELGAVPATIAVLDGVIRVGLGQVQLERLAFTDGLGKAGARDLAYATACHITMATTVSASLAVAHAAGIHVFATGGVGGVHRGAETTGDISNDLEALARVPAITVSAGFKSILDLPRTLELLETLGVLIVGYRTSSLPNFYAIDSGFQVPSVDEAATVARIFSNQRRLQYRSGILVVNQPPTALSLEKSELAELVSMALAAAETKGVRGKELTPYLLQHMAQGSGGKTTAVNVALLVSNAQVAARIATALKSTEFPRY